MFRKKTLLTAAMALAIMLPALAVSAADGKLTPRLAAFLAAPDKAASGEAVAIWVKFTDKDVSGHALSRALLEAEKALTPAARARRAKGSDSIVRTLVNEADLPVASRYVDAVTATGAVPRQQSRWLNMASFAVDRDGLDAIAALPFVSGLDLVARGTGERNKPVPEAPAGMAAALKAADKGFNDLEYGPSLPALAQLGVPAAHDRGLTGRGVTVALFSTGFNINHECLADMDLVAAYDFVDDDPYVFYQPQRGDDPEQDLYGTAEASLIAGFSLDNIIGVAHGASLILAKTEDIARETPAEEDNWIAALEWAESLGVDIVNSGLGYIDWYSVSDLDGSTTSITIAAEMAAVRGVCVINSVGDMRGSQTWPGVIPPSDGRSVISVGSVDIDNQVTSFSSAGPTADGRIKPDVMALGDGALVAFDFVENMYYYGYGTNYATALVSGVVALMLEQDPFLNPSQVARALRETASRAVLPDSDFGWGVVDAPAALDYWTPHIAHTPIGDQEGGSGVFPVTATITSRTVLDAGRLHLLWRVEDGDWAMETMTASGTDEYTAAVPPRGSGIRMEYYIMATDENGHTAQSPAAAPGSVYSFMVGPDETPPVLGHTPLADQVPAHWPPRLLVDATDNTALADVAVQFSFLGGAWQGPFSMTEVDGRYELDFPYTGPIVAGMRFSYLIMARDAASVPNVAVAGPFDLAVVENRGRVLVVDDRRSSKSADESDRSRGAVPTDPDKSIADISTWVVDAGFAVDLIGAEAVGLTSFNGYDAVMVTCGSNWSPLAYDPLRQAMVNWARSGGRILVEGGEVGYTSAITQGYSDLMAEVLHMKDLAGEDASRLTAPSALAGHPFLNRPNILEYPITVQTTYGYDYGAADLVEGADDAMVLLKAGYGSHLGGAIVHDDNTGPDAGQTVYLSYDLMKSPEHQSRVVLENALNYMVQVEAAGPSSVSGRITLAGRSDYSGATVTLGRDHSTVTGPDGSYELEGLWGGHYDLTVTATGFAKQIQPLDLAEGDDLAGTNFFMRPVVEIAAGSTGPAAIPDNDPAGVVSEVLVLASGDLLDLNIDCDLKHYSIGQLTITLTSPAGTAVVLHNNSGGALDDLVGNWPETLLVEGPGSLDDFLGASPQGIWRMEVVDSTLGATGTLNSWTLNLAVSPQDAVPADDSLPAATRLVGNHPNPFNPRTAIDFELKTSGRAVVEIYDVRGSLVRRLVDKVYPAGRHQVVWDGRDRSGHEPASGLYFCRLRTANETGILKMTLVR